MPDALDAFLPAVQTWFSEMFGQPTPPQTQGWPYIQRGDHTLILSPTGSGKTLAAFLWGIDQLYRTVNEEGDDHEEGVRLLYVSPLKALNNDIERNLRVPLAGIRRVAREAGTPLPRLDVLVRTGDTPQSVRRRMVKHPPHILITTPESLYLILTSPVAREMFRTLHTVILDEIHTLVGNKRGVHLAVSLERAVHLAGRPVQRIGLSATQRPLDEVARFLGGYESSPDGDATPHPVSIVDAGMLKPMDLQVITAVEDFRELPGGSIWPAIMPQVMDLVEERRTTLIFANSRRQAERAADRLNDIYIARQAGHAGGPEALIEEGAAKAQGITGTGTVGGPFRAHHGSVSRQARVRLEQALKEGRLPGLVGTSSLELGIDIGSVDLVVQLQSPHGVARGLQRVGRSGHLVGQTSVGRIFCTHREDLLESAAIARAMIEGDVEPQYAPQNSLDVLAQQIVAMVSVQDWAFEDLWAVVRRAYPYHKLTYDLYRSVLDMLSGKYPSTAFRELRPRIAWDRVHNRLTALPGSRLLAIRNGGTIPDRGTFAAYLPDRKTRLGELDEEFVFETRPGDIFTLGASTWRVLEVTDDRLFVTPAPGHLPRMPFWKGDLPRRDYHLGTLYGQFRREIADKVAESEVQASKWLRQACRLDEHSARNAIRYMQRQFEALGTISSDRTIIAELFTDPLGDLRLVIHSCFGARVNSPWALVLAHAFREVMGTRPEVMVSDDGILFRFLETDAEPPLDLIRSMGIREARERLLDELPNSAVFGAQFRMNAARALLLPSARGTQKRTPFWLQRLRAKDLLAVAREFEDFPIIAETYRDCLRDVLDLAHLEEVLSGIHQGQIEVVTVETLVPSPTAGSLLYEFISQYMYEWDQPKAERQMQALMVGRELLAQLLDESSLPDLLRPDAVRQVDDRLQRRADGTRARTAEELSTVFLALGDLSSAEARERCDGDGEAWLRQLIAEDRLVPLDSPGGQRYVLTMHADLYRRAFPALTTKMHDEQQDVAEARRAILRRTLSTHGPLTRDALLARYPWDSNWLDGALDGLVEQGEVVRGQITVTGPDGVEFCDRRNLERIHRQTLSLLRKEVEPVSLYDYADFVARWQHLHPAHRLSGAGSLVRLLQQLRGVPAPGVVWERDQFPLRLESFAAPELEALCQQGDLVWVGSGGKDPRRARVRFFFRGEGHLFLPAEPNLQGLSPEAADVYQFLQSEGACFFADLEMGLDFSPQALGSALVELVMASLVTNDTLPALRQVLTHSADLNNSKRQPLSALEAELRAWRTSYKRDVAPPRPRPGSTFHRPSRGRLQAARRRVTQKMEHLEEAGWPGRWGLVHRMGVLGRPLPAEEQIERQARQLLQAYGIVTRQSLQRDPEGGWNWPALYAQYQRMEMRGEVRRGYFVRGLPGVQFALPEALENLREWTQPQAPGSDELVLMNATDPANIFGPTGIVVDDGDEPLSNKGAGEGDEPEAHPIEEPETDSIADKESKPDPARFIRIPGNYVVVLRGRPVLLFETGAGALTTLPDLPQPTLERALKLAVEHIGSAMGKLAINTWNGTPVFESPAVPLLEKSGFRREGLVFLFE